MEVNVVYCFFVLDFIHFARRRKTINHHVAGGTREFHPRVQDLQHPRLGKPRRRLQILDTRIGFPRPSHNVVIDSIIPIQLFIICNPHLPVMDVANHVHEILVLDLSRVGRFLSRKRFEVVFERKK